MQWFTQNYVMRGFWGDEAWTALLSQHSLPDILRITSEDFHPPLYYVLVHFWIFFFGSSEVAIRSLSLLFFLCTTAAVIFFVRMVLRSWRATIGAAALVLTSPILVPYAFEARSYALVILLATTSSLFFWRIVTRGKNVDIAVYIAVAGLGLYTHYYVGFIVAAHAAFILLIRRKDLPQWMGIFFAIGLLYLPWLPVLLSQVGSVRESYWIAPMTNRTHLEFAVRLLGGDFATPQRLVTVMTALVLVFTSSVLALRGKKEGKSITIFLWALIFIPLLLPTIISLVTPIFFYRYLVFLAIPVLLLVVIGMQCIRIGAWLLMILLLLHLSITVTGLVRSPPSMREALGPVSTQAKAGDLLVTVLPSFAEVSYYNRRQLPLLVRPEGLVQFSGKSLLDAAVRDGTVMIAEPPPGVRYWLAEPGPRVRLVE